ncbi:MAG: hypothetical protein QG593_659 [Patescibacteria group bacterium]|jgi:hypothetical protein|nr:hypothetical protein [Patescibacteria group bacterium]
MKRRVNILIKQISNKKLLKKSQTDGRLFFSQALNSFTMTAKKKRLSSKNRAGSHEILKKQDPRLIHDVIVRK